ncbi:MAG: glycosyltransferase family 2 protein, partial [Trueperaceae bacterium]|nr:glycosyltransferase family 2 protein [Trueperaceae bacterium]
MTTHVDDPADAMAQEAGASDGLPTVSVVLPVLNEAAHIEQVLSRLLAQDYPRHLVIEILVVDGRSEDGTRDATSQFQHRHPLAGIRLLDNPLRITSAALNIGIRAARGDVLVRMDGHAIPATDYVSRCVDALQRTGAANVGGVVEPVGRTPFGAAVALATKHPLGAGDARYRVGGSAGDVDTVAYGAFRREVFQDVGLFDESMVVNEDYEVNVRIRAAGYRIHFNPSIRLQYTPRGTVGDLWRQYFRYGWWKVETLRRVP